MSITSDQDKTRFEENLKAEDRSQRAEDRKGKIFDRARNLWDLFRIN